MSKPSVRDFTQHIYEESGICDEILADVYNKLSEAEKKRLHEEKSLPEVTYINVKARTALFAPYDEIDDLQADLMWRVLSDDQRELFVPVPVTPAKPSSGPLVAPGAPARPSRKHARVEQPGEQPSSKRRLVLKKAREDPDSVGYDEIGVAAWSGNPLTPEEAAIEFIVGASALAVATGTSIDDLMHDWVSEHIGEIGVNAECLAKKFAKME